MVMFCLSILSGFGIKALFTNYGIKGSKKMSICIILSIIILFEFAAAIPTQEIKDTPEFYFNISQEEDYSIIELPFCIIGPTNGVETMERYYEYQKVHNKKMFGGYWSRLSQLYQESTLSDPVINYLYSNEREDIYTNSKIDCEIDVGLYLKNKYDVQYIILHTNLLQNSTIKKYIDYLGNSYFYDNSTSSDPLIIYPLNKSNSTWIDEESAINGYCFIWLNNGWNTLESWGGKPTRWTSGNATLSIVSDKAKNIELSCKVRGFHQPKTLKIYANSQLIDIIIVPTNFINITTKIPLKEGRNIISFEIPEGAECPSDIKELNSSDQRSLSIAIQNISLKCN